ncbi:hypothetical protein E2C01_098619 [Portunus trituberculatus]|uniref:Uncharacterized protein n=1 Tax=Portunus trituberculatus TaxID=210409 RepID=A0A5B7K854_PORTR|nr:hypothetical protein [Portunus trituberculatus]
MTPAERSLPAVLLCLWIHRDLHPRWVFVAAEVTSSTETKELLLFYLPLPLPCRVAVSTAPPPDTIGLTTLALRLPY